MRNEFGFPCFIAYFFHTFKLYVTEVSFTAKYKYLWVIMVHKFVHLTFANNAYTLTYSSFLLNFLKVLVPYLFHTHFHNMNILQSWMSTRLLSVRALRHYYLKMYWKNMTFRSDLFWIWLAIYIDVKAHPFQHIYVFMQSNASTSSIYENLYFKNRKAETTSTLTHCFYCKHIQPANVEVNSRTKIKKIQSRNFSSVFRALCRGWTTSKPR